MDQLEMDPDAPRERARVLLVEGSFMKKVSMGSHRGLGGGGSTEVPAVLLIGYANDMAYFDSKVADFEDLLSRLWIR